MYSVKKSENSYIYKYNEDLTRLLFHYFSLILHLVNVMSILNQAAGRFITFGLIQTNKFVDNL